MPHLLVTGGAGFIGSHTVRRFLDRGWSVTALDNLSRVGSDFNLGWIRSHPGSDRLTFIQADVRDYEALAPLVARADVVLHAAGQTAVTSSVADPRHDLEANVLGTFNVLEAARQSRTQTQNPLLIYTSTNKVYGGMEDVGVRLVDRHYQYTDLPDGVAENQLLDFHSPYGCSKGAGDQYMRDYARIYGLRTVVFRQSCIYGTWQFGIEDQGWVAHFTISAVLDQPLTIYGDGMQVRDVLYIDDLLDAYEAVIAKPDVATGQVFNIGGGVERAISLLDLVEMLEALRGSPMQIAYDGWRPGDQRVYVSHIGKAERLLGWRPRVTAEEGIHHLYRWAQGHQELLIAARRQLLEKVAHN